MPSDLPISKLEVEFEEVDGKRRLKRDKNGVDPVTAYGRMLIEMDRDYRKENNDWPLVEVTVCKEKSERGEPDHYLLTVYSLESGKSKPISNVVIYDKATGKPAPILETSDPKYIPKSAGLVHVEQMLTHERLKAEAIKRGLQIKSESISKLDEVVTGLEG
jgi:hypothetical protein